MRLHPLLVLLLSGAIVATANPSEVMAQTEVKPAGQVQSAAGVTIDSERLARLKATKLPTLLTTAGYGIVRIAAI